MIFNQDRLEKAMGKNEGRHMHRVLAERRRRRWLQQYEILQARTLLTGDLPTASINDVSIILLARADLRLGEHQPWQYLQRLPDRWHRRGKASVPKRIDDVLERQLAAAWRSGQRGRLKRDRLLLHGQLDDHGH